MTSDKEPLSSKVKAFEVVSRVAGLGQTEQVAPGAGQFFKLEINLGGNIPPMVLASGVESMTIEHQRQEMRVHPLGVELASPLSAGITQSNLFASLPLEDL
jgi:hypothetical protein